MVGRSELLSAQSEAKANKEAAARAKDVLWVEGQLGKAQEQLEAARSEAARRAAEVGDMVPRMELAQAEGEVDRLRKLSASLRDRLGSMEREKAEAEDKMQASHLCLVCTRFLLPFC